MHTQKQWIRSHYNRIILEPPKYLCIERMRRNREDRGRKLDTYTVCVRVFVRVFARVSVRVRVFLPVYACVFVLDVLSDVVKRHTIVRRKTRQMLKCLVYYT